jgi:hypothetical protein
VIPTLTEIAERLGVSPAFVPIVLAGLLTGIVLAVQSVAQWFEDRNR